MKGISQWKITSSVATTPQLPRMRSRYHGISSGELPDQIIRNAANARYMFNIVKAKHSLPMSCCSVFRKSVLIGSAFESPISVRIESASTPYACATRNWNPYTVEYHVGSSDITQ